MQRSDFIKTLAASSLAPFVMELNTLQNWIDDQPNSATMPALFLGHGSPMNAIEDNQFVQGFTDLAVKLEKPRAILCISAHWLTRGTKVSAVEKPETIHDFGGFPQALYEVQYPAPGAPALAAETRDLLQPIEAELDQHWGLDHGAWSVVKHLFPEADVPVFQMSIDYGQNGTYHFELAKKLRSLRKKGVLIIGSGNIIHNLRLVDFQNFNRDNYGFDWAIEAREKINQLLLKGDYQTLCDYQRLGRAAQLAIPTPDHYFPLLYTLGLQEKGEAISLFNDKLMAGSLSMTSLKIA
jgi:4,5-DOPA dioxygenase extradiol